MKKIIVMTLCLFTTSIKPMQELLASITVTDLAIFKIGQAVGASQIRQSIDKFRNIDEEFQDAESYEKAISVENKAIMVGSITTGILFRLAAASIKDVPFSPECCCCFMCYSATMALIPEVIGYTVNNISPEFKKML